MKNKKESFQRNWNEIFCVRVNFVQSVKKEGTIKFVILAQFEVDNIISLILCSFLIVNKSILWPENSF